MVHNKIYLADPDADDKEKEGRVGILNIGWSVSIEASKHSSKVTAEFVKGGYYCISNFTEKEKPLSDMTICNSKSEINRWTVKEECLPADNANAKVAGVEAN